MKNSTRKFEVFCLVALLALSACASGGRFNRSGAEIDLASLSGQIEAILRDSALVNARVGIKIVSLESGRTIYEKDSRKRFLPASNMKLLTTATALSRLGPNYRFRTVLHADTASVINSTMAGNLYLKGFGNPDLEIDDLRWLATQLSEKGIRRITGDLVCDATYFDDLYWGKGWMWDDGPYWFWAPIGALTVNDNCVAVFVKPGDAIGDSLRIRLKPQTSYLKVHNLGVTVDSLDTLKIREFRVERKWKFQENTITVQGGMPLHGKERAFVRSVVQPALFVGALFSELLAERGAQFGGSVRFGELPDTTVILATHFSEPLADVINNTNKTSDNLSAEMLLKTLAAELKETPGTGGSGVAIIKSYLAEIGIDTLDVYLVDGSGNSRYNLISPSQIVTLLAAVNSDFRIHAEFKASLPIAGVDGTLRRRMQGTPAEGKLRAKTGNLRGASTLSGYTTSADGELLAFSFMMDDFVVSNSEAKRVQDRLGALISGMRTGGRRRY